MNKVMDLGEEKPQRQSVMFVTSDQEYILLTWLITTDVNTGHPAVAVSGFSTVKLLFFSFFILYI